MLGPAGTAVDGAALLSPQGEVIYAVGSLQAALASSSESSATVGDDPGRAARQQFVGLFEHAFDPERRAERLRRMAVTMGPSEISADASSSAADEEGRDEEDAVDRRSPQRITDDGTIADWERW